MIILIIERHHNFEVANHYVSKKIMMDRNLTHDTCVEYTSQIDVCNPSRKIETIRKDILARFNYPAGYSEPGDEAAYIRRHVILCTTDPFIIDILNFELLKNPKLHFEAFEAIPANHEKNKPVSAKIALVNGQIKTDILLEGRKQLDSEIKKFLKKKKK